MAEKRVPSFIFLLKKQGKKSSKIELFKAAIWRDKYKVRRSLDDSYKDFLSKQFRLRINGKWYCPLGRYSFFTKSEIKEILWRSIKF